MNNKILMVATLVFAIMFIGLIAILNSGILNGLKDVSQQMSINTNSNKYSQYLNHTLSGEVVLDYIDKNSDGCFFLYMPGRDTNGENQEFGCSLGLMGTKTTSTSTSTVNFTTYYALSGTGNYNTKSTVNQKYTTTTSSKLSQSLTQDERDIIITHDYIVESLVKWDNSGEVCGLVFREKF